LSAERENADNKNDDTYRQKYANNDCSSVFLYIHITGLNLLFNKVIIKKWFYTRVLGIKYLFKRARSLKLPVKQHCYPVARHFGAG
jgi:hypothetical protein